MREDLRENRDSFAFPVLELLVQLGGLLGRRLALGLLGGLDVQGRRHEQRVRQAPPVAQFLQKIHLALGSRERRVKGVLVVVRVRQHALRGRLALLEARLLERGERLLGHLLSLAGLPLFQQRDDDALQRTRLAPPVLRLARQRQGGLRREQRLPRRLHEELDVGEHLQGRGLQLLVLRLLRRRQGRLRRLQRFVDPPALDERAGHRHVRPRLEPLVPDLLGDLGGALGRLQGFVVAVFPDVRPHAGPLPGDLQGLVVGGAEQVQGLRQGRQC
mmetsp:Transcript_94912/g.290348  ORF Transcript_94912/g.290348 Transcript_94912/m.290348 type:complete len:273 (+) Transcript_94912:1274-2092(+)